MEYREHPPSPALGRRVACYWTMRASSAGATAHRVLADGCSDLLFAFEGGGVTALAVGVMTRAIVTPPAGPLDLLGVRFLPGEAHAFFAVAATDLADVTADARAVVPDLAAIVDRLATASSCAARRAVLDRALLQRSLAARPVDARLRAAVSRMRSLAGRCRVADVARALDLSERQLARLCVGQVGVAPKVLARSLRLQAFAARLGGSATLAALAAELGYADQAHLALDVRALAGVAPSVLAGERAAVSDSFKADAAEARTFGA